MSYAFRVLCIAALLLSCTAPIAVAEDEPGKAFADEGIRRYKQRDYVKAIEALQKAAAMGHADAAYNLGFMYAKGKGVEKDYGKALKWFKIADERGSPNSLANIGMLYLEGGPSLKQDFAEALKWFQEAVEDGDANAMFQIALMYRFGRGVPKDISKAEEWYARAAKLGQPQAQLYFNMKKMMAK